MIALVNTALKETLRQVELIKVARTLMNASTHTPVERMKFAPTHLEATLASVQMAMTDLMALMMAVLMSMNA